MAYKTHVGSLQSYKKGVIELDDDLRKYAFSNVFEVAGKAKPFERVAVVQNLQYVAEVVRAEGDSPWYAAPHDEFAIVMDGEVTFNFVKLADDQVPSHEGGAAQLGGEPNGPRMGRVVARRGHQVLLPQGSAYQMSASQPAVAIVQTMDGPVTVKRFAEICTLKGDSPMTVLDAKVEMTGTDPETGYSSFRLGSFEFRRDEYFAHVKWPKGSHIIEIDRFLRAMVRDIGWGFFYGWIFFDDIFGTTNHYGTVDIFAGAYDRGCKEAGIDWLETFSAEAVSEAFTTISQDWISEGYDPLNAPLETGTPIGKKGQERKDPLLRAFIAADRMLGLEGDKPVRREEDGFPINRAFADLDYDTPEIECEPGFEGQLHAINLFDHIARSNVTWNPSISAVTGGNICCVTSEEHMLPVIHGNDRNEWFIQLTDEIHWNIADKNTGAPRGRVVMRAGDVCAMPADIRHQGFAPKRAMLMVMENGTPGLEKRYASGELPPYPVDFG